MQLSKTPLTDLIGDKPFKNLGDNLVGEIGWYLEMEKVTLDFSMGVM